MDSSRHGDYSPAVNMGVTDEAVPEAVLALLRENPAVKVAKTVEFTS